MNKLLLLPLFSLLFPFFSCTKREAASTSSRGITARAVDLRGNPVSEVHSGQIIRILSEDFRTLNQNGDLQRTGKILFDNIPAPILFARGDVIEMAVPVMKKHDYWNITLTLQVQREAYALLLSLVYLPTVTGAPFAGIGYNGPDGTFKMPGEMALDKEGNLYVIDQQESSTQPNDVIIKVTSSGSASLFAGGANQFGRLVGIGIDAERNRLYVADATSDQVKWVPLSGPATINILAGSGKEGNTDGTGAAASFRFGNDNAQNIGDNERGQGMALDAAGNIYVGERWGSVEFDSQIRRSSPEGVVTTVMGSRIQSMAKEETASIAGLTLNGVNEPVWTGGASGFFQGVTRLNSNGVITRLAGEFMSSESLKDGTGMSVFFAYPKAITFNAPYYYVADGANGALRRVSASGEVITLAGVGHDLTPSRCKCTTPVPQKGSYVMPSPKSTDPNRFIEKAKAIRMDWLAGVAVWDKGLIYVSDCKFYRCIWKISIE